MRKKITDESPRAISIARSNICLLWRLKSQICDYSGFGQSREVKLFLMRQMFILEKSWNFHDDHKLINLEELEELEELDIRTDLLCSELGSGVRSTSYGWASGAFYIHWRLLKCSIDIRLPFVVAITRKFYVEICCLCLWEQFKCE